MGAGWWEQEHRTHGFPFPPAPERFERLEEQLEIVHRLMTEDRFTFVGRHYRLDDVPFAPKGAQTPHPPIIVGGGAGPRLARLVSRWADEYNTVGGPPASARERFQRIMLNHELFDDLEMLEILAEQVFPNVAAPGG